MYAPHSMYNFLFINCLAFRLGHEVLCSHLIKFVNLWFLLAFCVCDGQPQITDSLWYCSSVNQSTSRRIVYIIWYKSLFVITSKLIKAFIATCMHVWMAMESGREREWMWGVWADRIWGVWNLMRYWPFLKQTFVKSVATRWLHLHAFHGTW